MLVGILLCPAIIFYVADKAPGRPVGRSMLLTGSAAVFGPLRSLWTHDNSFGTALDLLSDPACPLRAWFACGAGWLICEVVQGLARFALATQNRRQTEKLTRELEELKQEWTLD